MNLAPVRRPPPGFIGSGGPWYALAVVGGGLLLVGCGFFGPANPSVARGVLVIGVALFWVIAFTGLGMDVTRRPAGILTSGSNRYSLSRLQMVLWSWVILSAVTAAVLARALGLGGSLSTAFAVGVDGDLYAVMGISLFTGAATPALLALKAQGSSDAAQRAFAAARMNEPISVQGQVVGRPASQAPRLGDLVEGDEVASAGTIDLSKVQQLMLTVVLVGVYAAMVFDLFVGTDFSKPISDAAKAPTTTQLPSLSDDMIKLLLLSHAGYLGYKAAPKPPAAADAAPGFAGPPATPDRKAGLP